MSEYSYPNTLKKLRACLTCHLIKTEDQVSIIILFQFYKEGCENCEESWNRNEASHKITQNFKGMIAITNPKNSWCARWLKKSEYKAGFYCIDIITDHDEEEEEYLEYDDEEEKNHYKYENEEEYN